MPDQVADQSSQVVTTPQPAAQEQAQKPPSPTKASNAEKIAKAQQDASAFMAKKLLESSKAPKKEGPKEPETKAADKKEDAKEDKVEAKKETQKEEAKEHAEEKQQKAERNKPAKPERREVGADEIAEAAARGVAKALQKDKPKEDVKKEYSKDDLPPEFADVYDELVELPKLGGKWKGRDIVAEVAEKARAIEDYKAKWLKKNKGQEFDPESDEHQDFMAENAIEIPQTDLIRAAKSVAASAAEKSALQKVDEKYGAPIKELEKQKQMSALRPVYNQAEQAASEEIAAAIGEDVLAAFKKGPEEVAKLRDTHPYMSDVADAIIPAVQGFADVATTLIGGVEKFDPKNGMHAQFQNDVLAIDKGLSELDEPPTLKDGREFASLKEFNNMSPRQQAGYFTVADVEAVPIIAGFYAKTEASKAAGFWKSRHERWVKANGGKAKEASGSPSKEAEKKEEHKPAPTVTPSASKIPEKKDGDKPANPGQYMASVFLSRK